MLASVGSAPLSTSYLHRDVYPAIVAEVRELMADTMVKPKEVLIVIDENGEAVEELYEDTETHSLYETMRETMIYLTNLDNAAMNKVI